MSDYYKYMLFNTLFDSLHRFRRSIPLNCPVASDQTLREVTTFISYNNDSSSHIHGVEPFRACFARVYLITDNTALDMTACMIVIVLFCMSDGAGSVVLI